MISGWWLFLAFLIGVYAGVTLMAALIVSSHRPVQADPQQLADDPRMSAIVAEWLSDKPGADPNRERTARKRSATSHRDADPLENQANFQW